MTPSCRSVAIDMAGPIMANARVWMRMPPMRYSLYPAPLDVDGAAEHVGEQQHEHQRLDRDVGQLLGNLADVLEVAAGEDRAVGQQGVAHAETSWLVCRALVRARNTSSSVASRRVMSTASMPASSRARTTSIDADAGLQRSGDDQLLAVEGGVAVGECRQGAGGGDELAGGSDLHVDAIVADASLQLLRRAVGNGLAVIEHDDVVGHPIGLLEVLRGEDDGGAAADEVGEHLPQVAAAARIEAGGGLVEEQHLGAAHQAGSDVETATHAAGVGLHQRRREVGEIELLEQLVAALTWQPPSTCRAGGRWSAG